MPSSLFPEQKSNSIQKALHALAGMAGGNSLAAFDYMAQTEYQNNPQYRQFADSLKGKTPQQAFGESGYDFSQVIRSMS